MTAVISPLLTSHRKQLRSVLMLAFATVAVLMAISLSLILGHLATERERQEISAGLQELGAQMSQQLDRGINQRIRDLQVISSLRQIRDPQSSIADNQAVLEKLKQTYPAYAFIGFANPDGTLAYATQGLLEGKSMLERPWFAAGKQGTYVGDVHEAKLLAKLLAKPSSGEPLRFVDISTPVYDLHNQLLGVLGAHLSWEWAREREQNVFSTSRHEQGVQAFVLTHSGQVLLAPSGLPESQRQMPAGLNRAAEAANVLTWPDGKTYLTAVVPTHGYGDFKGLGWTVVVRQPTSVAFAPVQQLQRAIWITGAIGTLIFTLLGAWLATGISRPMLRLAQVAQRLRAGESELEIPLETRYAETERLSASLRHLVAGLNAERGKLAALNQSLEEEVAARTQMLDLANTHLLTTLEERSALVRQLEELASTDTLTGLMNRRAFWRSAEQEFKRALRSNKPLSLVMLDIDHFKQINDLFGHSAGDEALTQLARNCLQELREVDLMARLGGEEFVVLLPDADSASAVAVAERLRECLANTAVQLNDGKHIPITASFGVTEWARDLSLDQALMQTDQALYTAKNGGRNQVSIWDPESENTLG
ncbi:sensor domain-containing diguanylate cyclase [Silvimonas soli]|uniref:sensor domain-containing diguanylate cyclase n=1 Tax=Silvimonas soli TaxID=2980100 RepID=UPI0024B33FE5|nr:sensor domain-containing diguanylate cyclase [Silvimonas soli]